MFKKEKKNNFEMKSRKQVGVGWEFDSSKGMMKAAL